MVRVILFLIGWAALVGGAIAVIYVGFQSGHVWPDLLANAVWFLIAVTALGLEKVLELLERLGDKLDDMKQEADKPPSP
jgi:hypothetical protein